MYAKCGSIEDACKVFNKMPSHDVVTWNAMIFGHVKCGQEQKALELFQQMQHEGVQPDPVTFVGVLHACASVLALEEERCAHEHIIQNSCESDSFVGSSLVSKYAKCESMEDAQRCSMWCPHKIWYLGMSYLQDLPCMGMAKKLLNILNRCAKKG